MVSVGGRERFCRPSLRVLPVRLVPLLATGPPLDEWDNPFVVLFSEGDMGVGSR